MITNKDIQEAAKGLNEDAQIRLHFVDGQGVDVEFIEVKQVNGAIVIMAEVLDDEEDNDEDEKA